jgi:Ser/Thr protein kinase RdoA (MazF antagonist)
MSGFDESEQEHRSLKKPDPSLDGLADFLATNWGISADMDTLKKIESYDDANYFFQGGKRSFLLKFYNAVETECPDILHGLGHMLQRINQQIAIPLQVPSIVQPLSAVCVENFVMMQCRTASGGVELVAVRVFMWIEGTTLSRAQPDLRLMSELGTGIAEVWRALDGFAHPSFSRQHLWDLRQLALSKPLLCYVDCPQVPSPISLSISLSLC